MIHLAAFVFIVNFAVSSVKVLFVESLVYFLFFISLFFLLRRFQLKKILKPTIVGIAVIVFSYGLLQKFVLFPIYLQNLKPGDNFYAQAMITRVESGRIFSIFNMPTLYAIICAVLIMCIIHYLLKSPSHKFTWGILALLGVMNLVFTESFGGIIYLSVSITVYLLLSGILKWRYLSPIIMLFVLFFSIIIAFRFQEARKLEPARLRFSNWLQAGRMIQSAPFFGVGLGNYEANVSYFTHSNEAKSLYAHNFFLQFIAETGVLVPAFFLLLLFLSIKKLIPDYRSDNDKILYISLLFILLVYNVIDIGFYFFSAALAAAIVLSQLYPATHPKSLRLNIALLFVLTALLGAQTLSDNYRSEGDFLLSQGEFAKAETYYRKSIAVNPYNFKSLLQYGYLKLEQDKPAEAEKFIDRALALYPDATMAHLLKSHITLKQGLIFKAYYHAGKAYEKNRIDPGNRDWFNRFKIKLQSLYPQVQP